MFDIILFDVFYYIWRYIYLKLQGTRRTQEDGNQISEVLCYNLEIYTGVKRKKSQKQRPLSVECIDFYSLMRDKQVMLEYAASSNRYLPVGIYLLKVNNINTRTSCEICSKLTINIPERCHWLRYGIFIANFENISQFVLVFLLLTLNM